MLYRHIVPIFPRVPYVNFIQLSMCDCTCNRLYVNCITLCDKSYANSITRRMLLYNTQCVNSITRRLCIV